MYLNIFKQKRAIWCTKAFVHTQGPIH